VKEMMAPMMMMMMMSDDDGDGDDEGGKQRRRGAEPERHSLVHDPLVNFQSSMRVINIGFSLIQNFKLVGKRD
jgi:hypothetical protein